MTSFDTPLSSQALSMARLSRSEAQARTQLVQRVRDCEVTVAGSPYHLTLLPLLAPWVAQHEEWLLVKAHWAGAGFSLLLPVNAAQAWIQSRFPELDLPTLPHAYLAMMLETALADVCTGLAGLQRGAARIDATTSSTSAAFFAESSVYPHAFEMQLVGLQGSILLYLATNSLGLMLMAGLSARLPVATNTVPADALPVLLRAEVGCAWLNPAEFSQLEQGDTVLLAHTFAHPDQRLWLSVNERFGVMVQLSAAPGNASFEVLQAFGQADLSYFSASTLAYAPPPMTPSDTPTAVSGTNPATSVLDAIAFRLTFDLGERLMSLGEIKALQAGQLLALDRPLSHAVSLRVNNTLVGQGELVEIDGRLGVTVTALAGSTDHPLGNPSSAQLPDASDQ